MEGTVQALLHLTPLISCSCVCIDEINMKNVIRKLLMKNKYIS